MNLDPLDATRIATLLGVVARARRTDLLAIGLLIGLFAGFATDAIVITGGVWHNDQREVS